MISIKCNEIIVKFKQGSGLNDQLIRHTDVGDTTHLQVSRRDDMLIVDYDGAKGTRKSIIWNFPLVISEFACSGVSASEPKGIAPTPQVTQGRVLYTKEEG